MLNEQVKLNPTSDRTKALIDQFGEIWYLLKKDTNDRVYIESKDRSTVRNVRITDIEKATEKKNWWKEVHEQ